ncbi:MAG: hypothetical protein COT74_12990 [Bdellovibrionales bacterium CG10_big_fil_rev_8_21_14_0_10_45_34]|nr:MAG: hypothetical protein COT74_12990 [Bdellovibrionales bacterium CG10_big_fil_rev_8_21_14_0_10_45_34]
MRKVDFIVSADAILTANSQQPFIEKGAVAVQGSKIVGVETQGKILQQYESKKIFSLGDSLLTPGLINTHAHLPMSLLRGIANDLSLDEWLTKHIFPKERQNCSKEFVRLGTELALSELLLSGVTTVCDMYFFEDDIAEVCEEMGMRSVLGQSLFSGEAPDQASFEEGFHRAERFISRWKGHELVSPALAPHAPYSVDPDQFRRCAELAKDSSVLLMSHILETKTEDSHFQKRYGMSVTEMLEDSGCFEVPFLMAHFVWPNDSDLKRVTKNVAIAHCPQSNLKLADGFCPVQRLHDCELTVGLGTDGPASNNDFDFFAEIQTAALIQKAITENPESLKANKVFEMATLDGAKALALQDKVGSLQVGKCADIIAISRDGLHHWPHHDVYAEFTYATKASDVTHVWVNGELLVENKKLTRVDQKDLRTRVKNFSIR